MSGEKAGVYTGEGELSKKNIKESSEWRDKRVTDAQIYRQ